MNILIQEIPTESDISISVEFDQYTTCNSIQKKKKNFTTKNISFISTMINTTPNTTVY